MRSTCVVAVITVAALSRNAAAQKGDDAALKSQWFTGSLEAPSPALPKAGLLAVEPYLIYASNTGTYDLGWTQHSVPDGVRRSESLTALKYGLTNRVTIQALPSLSRVWNRAASSVGVGDLPIELEYRFSDESSKSAWPSVTTAIGMSLPAGTYDGLKKPIDGLGSGAYTVKEGILLQSLFDSWGDRPTRVRLYGAVFESVADVSVHDISVYGTSQGFRGKAAPGVKAKYGFGMGYGLNQRCVLALDLLQGYANGLRLNGTDAAGAPVNTRAGSSTTVSIAPAIEYNWSGRLGIIGGVEFSAAGRNSTSYVSPQLALSMAF